MNELEVQRLRQTVSRLESRVARLEGLLLRGGIQIGETEHGDVVWSAEPCKRMRAKSARG